MFGIRSVPDRWEPVRAEPLSPRRKLHRQERGVQLLLCCPLLRKNMWAGSQKTDPNCITIQQSRQADVLAPLRKWAKIIHVAFLMVVTSLCHLYLLHHFQNIPCVPLMVRQHVSSCAPSSTTPSDAPVCQDSNYRATNGAASPKVWFTNIQLFLPSLQTG